MVKLTRLFPKSPARVEVEHRAAPHRREELNRLVPRLQLKQQLQVQQTLTLRRGGAPHDGLERVLHLGHGRADQLTDPRDAVSVPPSLQLRLGGSHGIVGANLLNRAHAVDHEVILESVTRVELEFVRVVVPLVHPAPLSRGPHGLDHPATDPSFDVLVEDGAVELPLDVVHLDPHLLLGYLLVPLLQEGVNDRGVDRPLLEIT